MQSVLTETCCCARLVSARVLVAPPRLGLARHADVAVMRTVTSSVQPMCSVACIIMHCAVFWWQHLTLVHRTNALSHFGLHASRIRLIDYVRLCACTTLTLVLA